jgi:uncharacterized membrane protein
MAQVTGMTSSEIEEELDTLLLSGRVDQISGHLLLETRGGAVIDAGAVETSAIVNWADIVGKPTAFAPTTHVHIQDVASDVWTINHGLNRNPQVTIVDSSGSEVVGDVTHVDINTVVATFGGAFGGRAYLT